MMEPYTITDNNDVNFEEVIRRVRGEDNLRGCRALECPEDYLPSPGDSCELITSGSGYYCQWYHYLSLSNDHYLIFRSHISLNGNQVWRYMWRRVSGVPISFGYHDDNNELTFVVPMDIE